MDEIYNVVIGTAGHIDHGKSTLVKALTGIDPDRLIEEKEREMTTDIGFAPFVLSNGMRVGVIDVPGHERFIKNMLAGATGVDIVLLVVSGTDGVMLQTREHVAIMNLLGLKRGIIVLNKADVADEETLAIVEEDVKELVKGTFLEKAKILRVSAMTGKGIPELKKYLEALVLETPPHDTTGIFRMPIQRVFVSKGFGTIVTGVPISGEARTGEGVEIIPPGVTGRIKGFQAYKMKVDHIRAGHSSAINVSDVDHSQVKRGCVAASPGHFRTTSFVAANFTFTPQGEFLIEKWHIPVKFYSGTFEADGQMVLLDVERMDVGQTAVVQFVLDDPVVVDAGDRFILRDQTSPTTLGGGVVISIGDRKIKRRELEIIMHLESRAKVVESKAALLDFYLSNEAPLRFTNAKEVSFAVKMPAAWVMKIIETMKVAKLGEKFVHEGTIGRACDRIESFIKEFHQKKAYRAGITKQELIAQINCEDELFGICETRLLEKKTIEKTNDRYKAAGFKVTLSKEESQIAKAIETVFQEKLFNAPSLDELYALYPQFSREKVLDLTNLLAEEGKLVHLKDDIFLHSRAVEHAKKMVVDEIKRNGFIETGKVRDLLNTSRKYVIPLLEHFDKIGLTRREENRRFLV